MMVDGKTDKEWFKLYRTADKPALLQAYLRGKQGPENVAPFLSPDMIAAWRRGYAFRDTLVSK